MTQRKDRKGILTLTGTGFIALMRAMAVISESRACKRKIHFNPPPKIGNLGRKRAFSEKNNQQRP